MKWVGLLIVAPIWGVLSTQLFLQAWLALINGIISIIGFVVGHVQRKRTALGIGVGLGSALLFSCFSAQDIGYYRTFCLLVTVPVKIRFIGFLPQSLFYICYRKFQNA